MIGQYIFILSILNLIFWQNINNNKVKVNKAAIYH